jgi:hypothetical protein
MSHTTPPRIDTTACVQLITPGGLIVPIRDGDLEACTRKMLDERTLSGDTRAAIAYARLTGLDVTIRRETQTTVRATDLETTK